MNDDLEWLGMTLWGWGQNVYVIKVYGRTERITNTPAATLKTSAFCEHPVYVFRTTLTINSASFPKQH